ncbi:MAG: phosphoribosyltransferase [Hyphomicrobiales bacterium]
MPFKNRTDAGKQLALALERYRHEEPVVLALPRGGVPVAAEVATALQAPLDLLLVRKIGLPSQPELAMGAVVDDGSPVIVRNEDVIEMAHVAARDFDRACKRERAEIERRRRRYLGTRAALDLSGRTVIVIDDGLATGATMRAALRAVRMRGPRKVVLAVPVAPTQALTEMRAETDEIVCLDDDLFFGAIGSSYADFRQVTDEEGISTLANLGAREHVLSSS